MNITAILFSPRVVSLFLFIVIVLALDTLLNVKIHNESFTQKLNDKKPVVLTAPTTAAVSGNVVSK